MTKRKAILIANPRAGRGGRARARSIELFCEHLRRRGIEIEVAHTSAPHDAARLAAEAARAGYLEVIVSGGDGTINEALQGLVGTEVRLGVWPAGTANVLARALKLPFEPDGAAEIFARGRTSTVRLGCATQEQSGERRYFFLMAGIGLDASVAERVRPRLKRRVGQAAFWFSGLEHLARWQPRGFQIEIDGQTFPATFAAIGKSPRYGGDLAITPRARLDAPDFEVCIVNSQSRLRYLHLLSHALRGGVSESFSGVCFRRAARLRATGDALVQADGEIIGRLPMSFEIIPGTLEIFT